MKDKHGRVVEGYPRVCSTQFAHLEEYCESKGILENSTGQKMKGVSMILCMFPPEEHPEIEGDAVGEISMLGRSDSSTHLVGLSVRKSGGCVRGASDTYFLCPSCGTRHRYLRYVARELLCVKCGGLHYESSPQRAGRGLTVARHLRARHQIGYDDIRPKGMHQKTFQRVLGRIVRLESGRIERYT